MLHPILDAPAFLERLRSGDHEAYEKLWRAGSELLTPCYNALGFINDAEDLWSETFIKLWQTKCSQYDPQKSGFARWVKIVGKRVALDRLRRQRRWREIQLAACEVLICSETNADEKVGGSSELQLLVRSAKAALSRDDRTIISLRVEEGLPYDLIAEKLKVSKSTARMRLSRALDRLWGEMERLSPRELPKRIGRLKQRHPRRAIPAPPLQQWPVAQVY